MSGIYVHVPFCKQACHYCDFHFSTKLSKKDDLLQALKRELELRQQSAKENRVNTIYFGGGTPSLLAVSELADFLDTIYTHFSVIENPEITLEANPDDLSKEYLKQLSQTRVNRLSIGVQSFFDSHLQLMNRAHSAREAESSLHEARNYFDNVSVDLIYGIPGMSDQQWQQNIEKAVGFNISHLSCYALTIEPKTALKKFIEKGSIQAVDEVRMERQFYRLIETLEGHGYEHYEISNFGKPGYYAQNNTAYWKGKPYLGIGPSAHSYDGRKRSWNISNNYKYIKALKADLLPCEEEVLSLTDRYNEQVMTGLRTRWGITLSAIEASFGRPYLDHLHNQAGSYIKRGLLSLEEDALKATRKGKFLVDGIASDLFMINTAKD